MLNFASIDISHNNKILNENDFSYYIGLTKNTFNDILYKNKNWFRYKSKESATEVSSLYRRKNMQRQNYI